MKRILLVLSLLLLLSGCSNKDGREELNLYNWGDYIDTELLRKFEDETGIRVIYSNYNTNEDMYVKLKSGGTNYDLVIPSDYMIERLIKEDMLRKINWDNVPNRIYVDEDYLYHSYDPNQEYSIPFFWGTLGIIYNTNLVDEEVDSWGILFEEKYKRNIIMMDTSRDSLGVALSYLGYSMNSVDLKEMEEARDLLIKQYPLVYAYLVDQTRDVMINGEAALGLIYSGDALDALSNNEDLAYVIPKEGSNLWFDSMVIPASSKNPENAEAFINFMLRPENAAQNSDYIYYSIPSSEGRALSDEEIRDSEVAYPNLSDYKFEIFHDPGPYIKLYDNLWQDVKNQ
ncbi:MAG: spermidine/putrescine ABC transporter substrate-binding protein [Tissierellia bacterium]|nr:spermidine/putrescine ABC transporter substrate-binding protein [Tissierellia bacterium]